MVFQKHERQKVRLQKLGKTYEWLAKHIQPKTNKTYLSLYFRFGSMKEKFAQPIENILLLEEQKQGK
jgi:hypothetical protein